jgi:hypothetical protein
MTQVFINYFLLFVAYVQTLQGKRFPELISDDAWLHRAKESGCD